MAVCNKKMIRGRPFFLGGGGGGGEVGVWRKHSHSLAYVIFSQLSNIQFFNYCIEVATASGTRTKDKLQ